MKIQFLNYRFICMLNVQLYLLVLGKLNDY